MKHFILASSLILVSASSMAAITPCAEIKEKIETKLAGKGVKNYTLKVVTADTETTNRIVANCDGGKNKIIYQRSRKADTSE